ncbi:ammonia-dependent NAD(+) synthetase [Nocardioides sp. zg-DK7169]|uniref:ammonia-dependent NAD(+) synthetase n=1 Tax=Nocardioides sp. zg-DK7169 TaxID=2736600 RepID=UPI0015516F95|nr:ammonia-dependent NAD(+) synthetase [Nocardioides sp. zg-DK7169]NPC97824.1 ammonia-dependent NAD(+) synthetase [Nocardioides sp. zg-DK7169]
MSALQQEIIETLRVAGSIDPHAEAERRIEFLADYLRGSGAAGYVLGISGGVDSTVAGKLAQEACRRAGGTFTAVRLPYHSQRDEDDAQAALRFISPDRTVTVDIGASVDAMQAAVSAGIEGVLPPVTRAAEDFNRGNTKARARMIAQYAVGAHASSLVVGTDQAAEAVMGFFTKHGDGACDVAPLTGLTKAQVRQVGTALEAPAELVEKTPTADLEDDRPGLPDEEAYGITYAQIDAYLSGEDVGEEVAEVIETAYRRTRHKRELPAAPEPVLERR